MPWYPPIFTSKSYLAASSSSILSALGLFGSGCCLLPISWIKFDEKGLSRLLEWAEFCSDEIGWKAYRKDWMEGRRVYNLEMRSIGASWFLMCSTFSKRIGLMWSF